MEQIAFIFGNYFFYWSSVILTMAAAAAVCVFLSAYLGKSGNIAAGFAVVPLALVLSLAAARLLHWYCYAESYGSLQRAFTDFFTGGFALMGVFAGCFAAAVLTRLLFLHRNLPLMLDCMSLAGAAGIAVGRLASFFNSSDRGQLMASIRTMPWVYPVVNSISGALEYRLATFLLQAMVTGIIFLALLLVFLLMGKRRRDGDVTWLFLLLYSAAEVVLDSTRYDSMYFHSNGFVSIIQVLAACSLAAVILVFSVRLVRARGWRRWYAGLWASMAALLGCAGYMEYYVQRHVNRALFAYSVMSGCLAALVILTLTVYFLGKTEVPAPVNGRFLKQK